MKIRSISKILAVLVLFSAAGMTSCGSEAMPEDFEFSLRWNTYGVSSYDSKSGGLIKTNDASVPEDYVTELILTDEERQTAWEILSALDWEAYPDAPENYDPGNGESEPSETIMLFVTYGDFEKLIFAEEISLSHDADNKAGQRFLDACDALSEMITSSEEWKALPDYEVFYD